MNLKNKLWGVLSLSAASIALLQSSSSAKAEPTKGAGDNPDDLLKGINAKTDHLILAPAHQEEINRLYAGHTSHSSHVSHYSGTGGDPAPAPAPYYAPANPPAVYTPPPVSAPKPAPAATNQTTGTNALTQTNVLAVTNSALSAEVSTNETPIVKMKKLAAQGSANAQLYCGYSYLDGRNGAERDVEKAKFYFELAAIQGDAMAIKKLELLNPGIK